jgi:hypothetical protein
MITQPRPNTHARSRRELALFTLAGLVTPLRRESGTPRLGVHTGCFRGLPLQPGRDGVDTLIQAMAECDVNECELSPSVVEPLPFLGHSSGHHAAMPAQMMRRELRKWRLRTPMQYFESIGSRFRTTGIRLGAYNYSPDSTFSDEEIDRGFSMARALGADILTASSTPELARRVAPFADKHQMIVAFTGQREMDVSPFVKLHVDLGQLIARKIDPVGYIRDYHGDIISIDLTDCLQAGDTVVWGNGDARIRDVLQLLKREAWPIRAYVTCQATGDGNVVQEMKRCIAYAKQAMA